MWFGLKKRLDRVEERLASVMANIDTAAQVKARLTALEAMDDVLAERIRSLNGKVAVAKRRDRDADPTSETPSGEVDEELAQFLRLQSAGGGPGGG